MLEEIFDQKQAVAYWTQIFDAMYERRGPKTWDYQWLYTCLKNNSLSAVSSVNLIANIGFGKGATHTIEEDARFVLPTTPVKFPLKHPLSLNPLRSMDRRRFQELFSRPILHRISKKTRRVARRIAGRLS